MSADQISKMNKTIMSLKDKQPKPKESAAPKVTQLFINFVTTFSSFFFLSLLIIAPHRRALHSPPHLHAPTTNPPVQFDFPQQRPSQTFTAMFHLLTQLRGIHDGKWAETRDCTTWQLPRHVERNHLESSPCQAPLGPMIIIEGREKLSQEDRRLTTAAATTDIAVDTTRDRNTHDRQNVRHRHDEDVHVLDQNLPVANTQNTAWNTKDYVRRRLSRLAHRNFQEVLDREIHDRHQTIATSVKRLDHRTENKTSVNFRVSVKLKMWRSQCRRAA